MAKYTMFFLNFINAKTTTEDWYVLRRLPMEETELNWPIDNCIKLGLAEPGKKYIFFGPKVYNPTELGLALRELSPY